MYSLKSLLLFLGHFSHLQYHAALALPTTTTTNDDDTLTPRVTTPNDPRNFHPNHSVLNPNDKPNVTEYSTTDYPRYDVTLICPSPLAPEFGSTSGAWKILNHLNTLGNGPPLPSVRDKDGCRRMGCEEGLGVFWCVRDVTWTYQNAPTYKTLAEQAQMVLDQEKCKTTDATNSRPLVAGEAMYGDAWSVVLKGVDC